MTFEEVLDQAVAMLQRRGRMTYRALKLHFQLDDETLEALKEEILYSQPQIVDDAGKGLLWTGETESAQAAASQPAQTTLQPATQEQHSPQVAPLPPAHPPDAERRQLTVMFCDLVDSTKLSSQLDPEEYRDMVRAYQSACTDVIQRYDGYIAQYLGDGLLVYFGYPVAHEDDAHRALHTGLGILAVIRTLNTRLEPNKGITLAVRLGVHTGLVVVGEMGGAGRQEQLALGEAPNVAARLQGLAAPDSVLISASTYQLVQGYFECQELGAHTLRGVAEPIAVYRVLQDSVVQSRLDVASTRGLTPLVGREQEVGLLLERWEQAKHGHGQVVLLSGEGGIGKSRLVQVLKEHIANEPHTRWECRSSPYYQNTALYPLTDFFHRVLQWQQEETPEAQLAKFEQTLSQYRLPVAETVPLFAPFLSLTLPEDRYLPLTLSPQRQRQKTLESLVAMLLELAEQQPVLFILEDLHWTDPTTLEFLSLLIAQVPTAALYTVLTCRPDFQPAWHHRSYLTEMTVHRLSSTQVEQIVTRITAGKPLPPEVLQQIIAKTDGVPLFVEEMTKAVLESGMVKPVHGQYKLAGSLASLTIPATLHDSLMARLDRLVTAKAVAQYAAAIGRQFSYELLSAVSQLDAPTLQRELGRLVAAELVYQRGVPPQATYTFKHALIRDAAYESLLKSTRQGYHQRIAHILEAQFPETAAVQPELLAQHYAAAGQHAQAVAYWSTAGEHAVQRSAHREAIAHLRQGLEGLTTLPATAARLQQELVLQTTLARALTALQGFSAVETAQAYTRARALCRRIGDPVQHFAVLRGLLSVHSVRGELQMASALSEELLTLAQRAQEPLLLATAYYLRGSMSFWRGAFAAAQRDLEAGTAYYRPPSPAMPLRRTGQDPGVGCLTRVAEALWMRGYPAQAVVHIQAAQQLAHTIGHPFTLAYTFVNLFQVYHLRREVQAAQAWARAAVALASEQHFQQWRATATCMYGWTLAMQGHPEESIVQIEQGLHAWRATDAQLSVPFFLAILAEAHQEAGQPEAGLRALNEALILSDKSDERWYEAEIRRRKGALLLQQSPDNYLEAETCFHQAIAIAQRQSAKSWELRAATSLARLWQRQGKRQAAYGLLAPVYGWFTEGFDTADLQEAKALLDALG